MPWHTTVTKSTRLTQHVVWRAMEESGYAHTASVSHTIHARNHSFSHKQRRFNRPLQHFSNLRMYRPGKYKTRFNQGWGNPKDCTCCCYSHSFFFLHNPTQSWWAWNDEPVTSTLELHTRLRNTLERTSALAISVLPPSPCRETLKQISRGTDQYDKWKYRKSRRNYAFWQINVSTYSDMFPSPNHVSSNVQTIACLECAVRTSCTFYSFIFFVLVSFVVLILGNRGQPVHFALSRTGWERVDLIT